MVSLLVQHPDRADRKDYTMGYLFGQEGKQLQMLLGYKTKGAHKEQLPSTLLVIRPTGRL